MIRVPLLARSMRTDARVARRQHWSLAWDHPDPQWFTATPRSAQATCPLAKPCEFDRQKLLQHVGIADADSLAGFSLRAVGGHRWRRQYRSSMTMFR